MFHIFNLDFFHTSILWKCICSRYLVSVTPPKVLDRSFWNFTGVFIMVWRYACAFYRILKLIFFFTFFTLLTKTFFAWFWVCSGYLVSATPPTVLYRSLWNFTGILIMVWRYACGFYRILIYIYIFFFFFYFFFIFFQIFHIFNLEFFHASILWFFYASILWKCICSRYLVSATPPTVLYHSHWNYTDVLTIVWRYAYAFYRILKLLFLSPAFSKKSEGT